jgi:hypothetical protein
MNLSFSTKLCIVACHSDTPLKKKIIQHNHPFLIKMAHTIYINSSRYDKSIPMIHTVKQNKYDKYNQILSTLNLQKYNVMIWMTDETILTFTLLPFIKSAMERGYHSYADIILQTPTYYLHPYPLSVKEIAPIKEASFFKSSSFITTPIPYNNMHISSIYKKYMLFKAQVSFNNQIIQPVKPEPTPELLCFNLPELQDIVLPERTDASIYETVLIAFQPLSYLEFLLRRMILDFPTWSHTIICGNENTDMITEWNLPIQIISLNIDSITPENYNEMLLMESFWLLFQGETLLVYNKDSQPLESTLDLVAIDNYVKLENNMSIRNKRAMVERLRTTPPEEGILEHIFFSGL